MKLWGKRTILLLFSVLMALSLCAFADEADEAPTSVDMMVICAHPGDEARYFGTVLANYAGEQGLSCRVVYLSCETEELKAAALETLRLLGVAEEPLFFNYAGGYFDKLSNAQKEVKLDSVIEQITALIREQKPKIVISHGKDGEFGHGMHQLTAAAVERAVQTSPMNKRFERSAKQFGVHKVSALYLHDRLSEPVVTLDVNAKLDAFGGRTSLEIAAYLEKAYVKAGYTAPAIDGKGYTEPYFRLADHAEGVEPGKDLTDDVELASGETKVPTEEWAKLTDEDFAPEPVEDRHYFTDKETVVSDDGNGHWEYHGGNLSVVIDRHTDGTKQKPVCYFVADIKVTDGTAYHSGLRSTTRAEYPWEMCRKNRAVIGITGDNINAAEIEYKGVIMRNGTILSERRGQDTLAFMPDLSLKIFGRGTVTGEEMLQMGIKDTYSFGPSLIVNGVTNPDMSRKGLGVTNPRGGIGMIEPGRYVIIACDGRQRGYSTGLSLEAFAHLFYMYGCEQAYNLDGGSSLSLVFMGEMLNKHGSVSSDFQRKLPDMLLFGHSENVPSQEDPVLNQGYGHKK